MRSKANIRNVALPIWMGRISPLFDTARMLLLVKGKNGREAGRREMIIIIAVGKTGWDLLVDGIRVLLDASLDPDTIVRIREIIVAEPTVSELKWVTGRNAGRFRFVEGEVILRVHDLARAEAVTKRIEQTIRDAVPHVERVLLHAEPVDRTHLRYAVPLADSAGTLDEHFGKAPYFAVVTVGLADGRIEEQQILANPFREEERAKATRVGKFSLRSILSLVKWSSIRTSFPWRNRDDSQDNGDRRPRAVGPAPVGSRDLAAPSQAPAREAGRKREDPRGARANLKALEPYLEESTHTLCGRAAETDRNSKAIAPYEPKVMAFCCRYCAYTAADLAGSMRLEYPTNVRVVHILCSGRIDAVFLLNAFEDGADAVYVAGCNIGDCHFLEGNLSAIRTVAHAKHLLAEIGLEPERLEFFHITASDGPLFAERANEMTERARRLGPNPLRKTMNQRAGGKLAREADAHPPLPEAKLGRLIRHEERVAGVGSERGAGAEA